MCFGEDRLRAAATDFMTDGLCDVEPADSRRTAEDDVRVAVVKMAGGQIPKCLGWKHPGICKVEQTTALILMIASPPKRFSSASIVSVSPDH